MKALKVDPAPPLHLAVTVSAPLVRLEKQVPH